MTISSENKIQPTRGTVTPSYFSRKRQGGKGLVQDCKFEDRESAPTLITASAVRGRSAVA